MLNPRYWPAWRGGAKEGGAAAGDAEGPKLAGLLSASPVGEADVEGAEEDAVAAAVAPCPDTPIAVGADEAISEPPSGGGAGGDIADPARAD